jgi:phosphoglycolate phosphatase-like HAD superfamily hydrolase
VTQPLDQRRVRAVLFDIDGTLADTDDLLVDRLADRLEPWSFLFPERDTHAAARRLMMNADNPFNGLYAWADRLYLDELWAFVVGVLPLPHRPPASIETTPVPGAVPAVHTLAESYAVGVVTTRSTRSAAQLLDALGLVDAFQVVANARSTLRIKPHPAPIRWAAKQLAVPPTACLMVGDTSVDMRAARAAGAQAVGVLCGFGDRHELTEAGAQAVIESPAELPDLLSRL